MHGEEESFGAFPLRGTTRLGTACYGTNKLLNISTFTMYPLFFYLCVGLYHHGINHLSFSRGSLRAHTIIHFNIVWRYTYSIRLFLVEAKHRYKGKNINRKHTLKI